VWVLRNCFSGRYKILGRVSLEIVLYLLGTVVSHACLNSCETQNRLLNVKNRSGFPPLYSFSPRYILPSVIGHFNSENHHRSPEIRSKDRIPWEEFGSRITWIFSRTFRTNRIAASTRYTGPRDVSNPKTEDRTAVIRLNSFLLLPLLGKLTESERLIQNYRTACVIVHELCVSIISPDFVCVVAELHSKIERICRECWWWYGLLTFVGWFDLKSMRTGCLPEVSGIPFPTREAREKSSMYTLSLITETTTMPN